jgi:hypothetical protein
VLIDPGDGLADGTGDPGPSALGRRRGSSLTTPQAERARELLHEKVAFGVGLRGPLVVPDGPRLGDVVVDLGEPPSVGLLGAGIEHLARVTERGPRYVVDSVVRLRGDEVEHVELPPRGRRAAERGTACP